MGYTLAVFGQASLNKNLIFDTLADHFRFGPLDDEGYYTVSDETYTEGVELLIAVESAEAAEALDALNEWTARAGMNYTLVTASGVKAKNLAEDAARIVSTPDVPERVAELLGSRSDDGHEVALAFAVEPGNPDEASRRLYNLLGGKLPTYSIGEGLLPVEPVDYLGEAQAATEEYVAEFEADHGPIPQEDKDGARRVLDEVTEAPGHSRFEEHGLLDLLGFLDAIDQVADEAQRASEDRFYRLHQLVDELRSSLRVPEELAEATEETGERTTRTPWEQVRVSFGFTPQEEAHVAVLKEQQLAAQEQPIEVENVKPTKVKREWKDPATGEWKPIGRGRPRKNVEIREVAA